MMRSQTRTHPTASRPRTSCPTTSRSQVRRRSRSTRRGRGRRGPRASRRAFDRVYAGHGGAPPIQSDDVFRCNLLPASLASSRRLPRPAATCDGLHELAARLIVWLAGALRALGSRILHRLHDLPLCRGVLADGRSGLRVSDAALCEDIRGGSADQPSARAVARIDLSQALTDARLLIVVLAELARFRVARLPEFHESLLVRAEPPDGSADRDESEQARDAEAHEGDHPRIRRLLASRGVHLALPPAGEREKSGEKGTHPRHRQESHPPCSRASTSAVARDTRAHDADMDARFDSGESCAGATDRPPTVRGLRRPSPRNRTLRTSACSQRRHRRTRHGRSWSRSCSSG